MLAARAIISAGDARALRTALDAISLDQISNEVVRRFLRGPLFPDQRPDRRALRRGRGGPAAHRALPQRHRHDALPDAAAGIPARASWTRRWSLRQALLDIADRHRETLFAAHTHTQPAQPTTVAHYLLAVIEQLERDHVRLQGAYERTNRCPLGSCAITGTAFPIDREMTADLLGFDGPTGNTYGSIATVDYLIESVSGVAVLVDRARPLRARLAAVVHFGVQLPSARRRIRADQQHHAAETEPGRARTCPRHRQQDARSGAGGDDHDPQHTVRGYRRHRRRSSAARRRRISRCDTSHQARRRGSRDR